MADLYKYRKPVRRHWYRRFKLRRRAVIIFALLILLASAAVFLDALRSDSKTRPTSEIQTIRIEDPVTTFSNQYFSFRDTGKWVLSKQDSTDSKYIFFKYRGVQPQQQLSVYINEVPDRASLPTSRVVPVRIVNNNSLDVANIYGPCVRSYGPTELHKVKTVVIEGATMLCDPDTPLYNVMLAEVGGDWRLPFTRKDNSPIQVVIIFSDTTFNPGPESILRIADSFKVL